MCGPRFNPTTEAVYDAATELAKDWSPEEPSLCHVIATGS